MTSVQAGSRGGTQDTYTREHPSPRPQPPDSTSPNFGLFTQGPAEVDQDFLSPEVRELLEQGALQTGLEVDNGDDGDDEEGDEAVDASSVYAISMYPVAQPSRQLGRASESGQDSATMCVPRPLPPVRFGQCTSGADRGSDPRRAHCMPMMSISSWNTGGNTAATTSCLSIRQSRLANT